MNHQLLIVDMCACQHACMLLPYRVTNDGKQEAPFKQQATLLFLSPAQENMPTPNPSSFCVPTHYGILNFLFTISQFIHYVGLKIFDRDGDSMRKLFI